jgi:hypothetical protein
LVGIGGQVEQEHLAGPLTVSLREQQAISRGR